MIPSAILSRDASAARRRARVCAGLGPILLALSTTVAWAQAPAAGKVWQSQTFPLRAGWSAIYSLVDASHASLAALANTNPDIEEIWAWRPEFSSLQFLESPDAPADSPGNWSVWRRTDPTVTLQFQGNTAYLVKLRDGAGQFTWTVKGSPVPVLYNWKSDGMNLIGFSTVDQNPPRLDPFLSPVPRLLLNAPTPSFYQYRGGPLGSNNPQPVLAPQNVAVQRGEAFWVRADDSARFYGPFEVQLQDSRGVHFGDRLSRYEVILRNASSAPVTVQARVVASEAVPAGGEPLQPAPPTLLVRGSLDPQTLNFGFQTLAQGTPRSWTLAPREAEGSEVVVVLGMDWSSLTGSPGALNGAILRFTDASGQVQYDVPVSARVPESSGLWVGEAVVTHVQEDLKAFRKSSDQGTVTAAAAGSPTLTWVKRVPEGGTPADAGDASKWHVVDGVYFRKVARTYPGVAQGATLLPPATDENGRSVADPGFYWQARPLDSSFSAGYYFDAALQIAVANGYRHRIELAWEKADGVANPPNGTFPAQQVEVYEGVLAGGTLPPPSQATLQVAPAFWNPRPFEAPDRPAFEYSSAQQQATARVAGDVTVTWLKAAAEASAPVDANDTAKWAVSGGSYFRKFNRTYPGVAVGTVLPPPTTNEEGQPLNGDPSYWQPRPFHPAFTVGYAFDPVSAVAVSMGTVAVFDLLWLRSDSADPGLGETRTVSNVPAGVVLPPPAEVQESVATTHWKARPAGGPDRPVFGFQPSGERYEVTPEGQYVQVSASQNMAAAAKSMTLRLILHAGSGANQADSVNLLQRVYFSTDASSQYILATRPELIQAPTTPVRRISSVHVPWSPGNAAIACLGALRFGLSGELVTGYADPIANPFVHAYHPDHDNLDPRFERPFPQGEESFGIRRRFTLTPAAPSALSFDDRARGGDTLLGVYEEQIQLEGRDGFAKEYRVRGGYQLHRIIPTPTLLQ